MKITKQKLLEQLGKTYCRLQTSKIEGIGVFAIQDIPKDTDPFEGVPLYQWHEITPQELSRLEESIQKMVSDFFGVNDQGNFVVPECGLVGMDISFFLNTSETPNVKTTDDGTHFITLKPISKGEELTVSYAPYDKRYT